MAASHKACKRTKANIVIAVAVFLFIGTLVLIDTFGTV